MISNTWQERTQWTLDPKACDGRGKEGGGVVTGEDDGDFEYPFFRRDVLYLSPLELGPWHYSFIMSVVNKMQYG